MKFRSEIEHLKLAGFISHGSPIVMLGSCFSDEISRKLLFDGFNVVSNPFGPIYSSAALKRVINHLYMDNMDNNMFFHDGLWRSFLAHTKLSYPDRENLEIEFSKRKQILKEAIEKAQCVIVTLGSARSYSHNGNTVVNCHKLPANHFTVNLASPEDVCNDLKHIADLIRKVNAQCKIILTVSPIRHGGFGLHGNQISKATLILGIDRFIESDKKAVYFPSYEILLDDLRDYRFYADDLKHPSTFAVNYIYEKFTDSFFDNHTKFTANDFHSIALKICHRTINNDCVTEKSQDKIIISEIENLCTNHPELGVLDINSLRQKLCIQ